MRLKMCTFSFNHNGRNNSRGVGVYKGPIVGREGNVLSNTFEKSNGKRGELTFSNSMTHGMFCVGDGCEQFGTLY